MELAIAPAVNTPHPRIVKKTDAPRNIPLIFGTFFLSGLELGVEMTELQEIAPQPVKLQDMPLAPAFVKGLFNLRGRILPVIDLRLLLQMQPAIPREGDIPCMVILSQGPACIGVLFDAIGEILRVRRNELVPVEQHNPSADAKPSPVRSILARDGGKRVIQILDLASLLAIQNLPTLERRSRNRLPDSEFVTQRMKDLRREKLIGVTLAGYNLALEMKCVLAVLDNKDTRPSPRRSDICTSVVIFRNHMIPIVPLAQFLRLTAEQPPQRIVICQVGEHQVGFAVDEVISIMPFSSEAVLPIPLLAEYRNTLVRGCFTHSDGTEFFVLNEDGTLASPEILEIAVGHRQLDIERHMAEADAHLPQTSILTFRMGKLFGIRLLDVVEVLAAPKQLVRTPAMPPAVLGVINLRGNPVSVVDPRMLLKLDAPPADASSSLLVFLYEDKRVALRVDSIEGILSVPAGPELDLPEIFFREEQPKLHNSFERGLHVESNGVKNVVLMLSAEQIVKRLVEALSVETAA